MCYFCNRKDTHCGVVCAIIYLRVIRTREQPRNASAFFWVWLLPFFCVRQLSRGQAAGRLPRSAERGILPAPAGASIRRLCSLFERLTVGNGQALTPADPRMRQALSPGTTGVEGRGLGRAQRRTGRRETAGFCTS